MRRHPSHRLTDEQLDRFDADGINDPTPAWLQAWADQGGDLLQRFADEINDMKERA